MKPTIPVSGCRRATRPRGVAGLLGWLCAAGVVGGIAGQASIRSAQEAYREGRFEEARVEYDRLLERNPRDARLAYNAGAAAFRAGDTEAAARYFETASAARDLGLQAEAFYNLGNSRFVIGEGVEDLDARRQALEEASRHYATTLELDPRHSDAKANLDLVRRRLAELTPPDQQQQQQQQQQKPGGKQDPKDSGDQQDPEKNPSQEKGQGGGDDSKDPGNSGDRSQQGGSPQEPGTDPSGDDRGEGKPEGQDPSGKEASSRASESDPRGAGEKPGDGTSRQDGGGDQGQGDRSGKGEGEQTGAGEDPGRIRAAGDPSGEGAEGQAGTAGGGAGEGTGGETVRMTVRQAERVLDEQRGEERALIWRPAQPAADSRARELRRKTW